MEATVRDTLQKAITELRGTSAGDPALEASLLLAHALGKPRTWLFAHPEERIALQLRKRFGEILAHRLAGTPIAYLVGEREFWSLPIRVTPSTLIPRPETELVVERALDLVRTPSARIADLGTGSGAISAALAHEHPGWHIIATDSDEAALATAQENFSRLNLANCETRLGDWLAALAGDRFDLIASNPPYIADGDPHLDAGDVRSEPRGALASGPDGMDALRRIIRTAPHHLKADGWLVLEHGWNQGARVRNLLHAAGYDDILTSRDLAGLDRVTEARWCPDSRLEQTNPKISPGERP